MVIYVSEACERGKNDDIKHEFSNSESKLHLQGQPNSKNIERFFWLFKQQFLFLSFFIFEEFNNKNFS